MGLSHKIVDYIDVSLFKFLYSAIVSPYVQYINCLYGLHLAKHIKELENA